MEYPSNVAYGTTDDGESFVVEQKGAGRAGSQAARLVKFTFHFFLFSSSYSVTPTIIPEPQFIHFSEQARERARTNRGHKNDDPQTIDVGGKYAYLRDTFILTRNVDDIEHLRVTVEGFSVV